MTYERFSEIWEEVFPKDQDGSLAIEEPLAIEGSSPETINALIAYGKGDRSYFNLIDKRLDERDLRETLGRLKKF